MTEEQVHEVATVSGVLDMLTDVLSLQLRAEYERWIPYPEKIKSSDCKDAFIYLKEKANI